MRGRQRPVGSLACGCLLALALGCGCLSAHVRDGPPGLDTHSQEAAYDTSGLSLVFGADASVKAVKHYGRNVRRLPVRGGFEVAEYHGAAKGACKLKPVAALTAGGFILSYEGGALTLEVTAREFPDYIALHGKLSKSTPGDRALIVSFALPVNAWGWNWWDDPSLVRRIDYGVTYANYGFMGERRDIPISRMPFAAIAEGAGGAGLALAVPIDEPRIFRFNYSTQGGLRVEFNLGLSPATEKFPNSADFTVFVYAVDPVWGLCSAAEKYYSLFPEAYTRRLPRDGVSTWRITEDFMPSPEYIDKWGIAFLWTPSRRVAQDAGLVRFLRDNGIIALRHREPWARWHLVYPFKEHPWYARFPARRRDLSTTPKQPPVEDEMAMIVEETKAPRDVLDGNDQIPGPVCEVSRATLNCLTHDENGRPRIGLWHKWSAGGWHSQIFQNVDPDIPEPNRATMARRYQFPNMAYWDDRESNVPDMISWDSMTFWTGFHIEDFRRANFRYLDEPLSFHYGTGKLMTIIAFHAFEMAREWCREVRSKGRWIQANSEPLVLLFMAQFIDAVGQEYHPDHLDESEMRLTRLAMGPKPCFYFRGASESGLRKMLAWGIHPSGAPLPEAEGSPAPDDDSLSEEQRLYLKYARPAIRIANAGWHPLTYARAVASRPADDYTEGTTLESLEIDGRTCWKSVDETYETPGDLFSMERFGDGSAGLYFTLRSYSYLYDEAMLFIDLESLGLAGKDYVPREIIEGRSLLWDERDGMMRILLPVKYQETLVISLEEQ